MTRAQFQRLIDACGTAPEQWPPGQRSAAERLLTADPEARRVLAQSQALDRSIRTTMQGDAAEADIERLLGALATRPLPAQHRGVLARWWPAALARFDFAPAWPRLAALAGVGVLGFAIGFTSLGMRLADDLAGIEAATEEVSLFDADAITGLRP